MRRREGTQHENVLLIKTLNNIVPNIPFYILKVKASEEKIYERKGIRAGHVSASVTEILEF